MLFIVTGVLGFLKVFALSGYKAFRKFGFMGFIGFYRVYRVEVRHNFQVRGVRAQRITGVSTVEV